MSLTQAAARARTRLMELAWVAGYPLEKILSYYPAVTSLAFQMRFITTPSSEFTPDDDASIAVNGTYIHDPRKRMSTALQEPKAPPAFNRKFRVGDWVEVHTFDAARTGVAHIPWMATIAYEDGSIQSISGGSSDRWSLSGSGARADYYPNGSFLIPPPAVWPRPAFLPGRHHQPTVSGRYLTRPTANPILKV